MVKVVNGTDVDNNGNLQFELNGITGRTYYSRTTIRPKSCSSKIFTGRPANYFCLDKTTGDIYTASSVQGISSTNRPKSGDVYILNLSLQNTSFPYRVASVSLKFELQDTCFPASGAFNNLTNSHCIPYFRKLTPESAKTGAPLNLTFKVPSYDAIVGFEVPRDIVASITKKFKLNVSYPNSFVGSPITSVNDYSIQAVVVNIPVKLSTKDTINVDLLKLLDNGKFVKVVLTTTNGFSMRYIRASSYFYSCTSNCLPLYKSWKESMSKYPSTSECINKNNFLKEYYENCLGKQTFILYHLMLHSTGFTIIHSTIYCRN